MLDACVNTLVRDGDDFLELVIEAIQPFVKHVIISIDSRSKDTTIPIARYLSLRYPNIEYEVCQVREPLTDLVDIRNRQLKKITEKWGWIIDSDEYYPQAREIVLGDKDAYAFKCWAPWTKTKAHRASSKNPIGRIFRNKPGLEWRGRWGKESLWDGNKKAFDGAEILPTRYIHLTHLKKDAWRKELKQERVADGKHLQLMPDNIIEYVKKVPHLREREI